MSDVKHYLKQVRYIDQNISSRFAELENLRRNIPSASNWDNEIVSQTRENRSFVDKLVKLDEDISERVDHLIEVKDEISKEIDCLKEAEHQVILREYYLNMKTFEEISRLMHMTERHCKRVHGNALQEFSEMFHDKIQKFIKTCP